MDNQYIGNNILYENLFFLIIIALTVGNVFAQGRIDFMLESNPVAKVSKLIGKKAIVSGNIRKAGLYGKDRVFVLGRIGNERHPPKYSTNLTIIIDCEDKAKFEDVIDSDLVERYVLVIGPVVMHRHKIAIRLKNRKDLVFSKTPAILTIR